MEKSYITGDNNFAFVNRGNVVENDFDTDAIGQGHQMKRLKKILQTKN